MKKITKTDDEGQLRVLVGTAWRRAVKRNCLRCGDEFVTDTRHTEGARAGRYCSAACGNRDKSRFTRHVVKNCVICKRLFRTRRRHQERTVTCSPECRLVRQKRQYKKLVTTTNFGSRSHDQNGKFTGTIEG